MYKADKYAFPPMPKEGHAEYLAEQLLALEEEVASSTLKRIIKKKQFLSRLESIKKEFKIAQKQSKHMSETLLINEYIKYCENLYALLE